ncbi:hypothetical protein D3C72_1766990 [compost metagenome]
MGGEEKMTFLICWEYSVFVLIFRPIRRRPPRCCGRCEWMQTCAHHPWISRLQPWVGWGVGPWNDRRFDMGGGSV